MKNKLFKSIGLAVLLLTLLVSNVFAFSLGTTDGVWGRIDSTAGDVEGATCERYGRIVPEKFTPIDTLGIINNSKVGPGGQNEKYVRSSTVCQGDPDGDIRFANNSDFDGWTRSTSSSWTSLGTPNPGSCTNASDLFISEYIFVTNNQIGIEIYNGTNAPVNLSAYSLLLYKDDRTYERFNLSRSGGNLLAVGDVHLVVSWGARNATTNEDQTFNFDNYSSVRTVVLVKNFTPAGTYTYGDQGSLPGIYAGTGDENQVRYGYGDEGCPDEDGDDPDAFALQSGFGFSGQADSAFEPAVNQPFPVGRFCHYNNPVSTPGNAFQTVPLTLTINDIGCPGTQTVYPDPDDNDLSFDFLLTMDETPNADNPCKFGPYIPATGGYWPKPERPASPGWPGGEDSASGDISPNRNGCADMVKVTVPEEPQSFKCLVDPRPAYMKTQEYFVSIVGFTPTTVGGTCPDTPVGSVSFNQVYTAEETNNCFCMYAAYTKNQITPVTLASFGANWTENGVLIDWETVSETNNFGFNILRAESVDGERVQINPEMIFSSHAPGDPFGSTYEYLDETAVPGTEYFYWLVDVPLDSSEPGIYGPISPAE